MGRAEKRKETTMQLTLKRAMEYVFDDANDQFPNGWETPLAEIYRKTGYEHYDHKQRKVWELTIRTPYNGEAPTTVICRRLEKAKELMEEDIRETLASPSPRFDAEDLMRVSDTEAHLGDEIFWEIEKKDLIA